MGFTTPCFIRKNTEKLRKKLEQLGYTLIPNRYDVWNIPIKDCTYLFCGVDVYQGTAIPFYKGACLNLTLIIVKRTKRYFWL